jgi:hypothetical protein
VSPEHDPRSGSEVQRVSGTRSSVGLRVACLRNTTLGRAPTRSVARSVSREHDPRSGSEVSTCQRSFAQGERRPRRQGWSRLCRHRRLRWGVTMHGFPALGGQRPDGRRRRAQRGANGATGMGAEQGGGTPGTRGPQGSSRDSDTTSQPDPRRTCRGRGCRRRRDRISWVAGDVQDQTPLVPVVVDAHQVEPLSVERKKPRWPSRCPPNTGRRWYLRRARPCRNRRHGSARRRACARSPWRPARGTGRGRRPATDRPRDRGWRRCDPGRRGRRRDRCGCRRQFLVRLGKPSGRARRSLGEGEPRCRCFRIACRRTGRCRKSAWDSRGRRPRACPWAGPRRRSRSRLCCW